MDDGSEMVHEDVGIGAAEAHHEDGSRTPMVELIFARNEAAVENAKAGNPINEDDFIVYTITVAAARRLLEELPHAIDEAIMGPPEEDEDNDHELN